MRVPCVREGRQIGGDHDRGDVAGAQLLAADVDAEPLQHALQRLLGERRIVERVAGAVEADDEAVTDELVLADAFDAGEVFDARRRRRRSDGAGEYRQRGKRDPRRPFHLLLPKRLDEGTLAICVPTRASS